VSNKPPFCWCHDDQIPDDADAVADDEPQEGVTHVSSWDEILYEMTNGEMGTKPPATPRRYEPPPRKKRS